MIRAVLNNLAVCSVIGIVSFSSFAIASEKSLGGEASITPAYACGPINVGGGCYVTACTDGKIGVPWCPEAKSPRNGASMTPAYACGPINVGGGCYVTACTDGKIGVPWCYQ